MPSPPTCTLYLYLTEHNPPIPYLIPTNASPTRVAGPQTRHVGAITAPSRSPATQSPRDRHRHRRLRRPLSRCRTRPHHGRLARADLDIPSPENPPTPGFAAADVCTHVPSEPRRCPAKTGRSCLVLGQHQQVCTNIERGSGRPLLWIARPRIGVRTKG
jgi:hypothetical protein